jgi:predicted RNase H-like nuclease
LDTFVDVVDQKPTFSVIALNAPIGGLNQAKVGGRTCDRDVRLMLGRRGAAVKSAPVQVDSREGIDLLPANLDAISQTLLPRYQEVANEMAPYRQRTVYEVNAELSFYQLNDDIPMQWSKHSEKGIAERRSLLEEKVPGALRIIEADVPGASISHLLDVAAIVWTARRIFAKAVVRLPADPEWDEQGLRMEIVR